MNHWLNDSSASCSAGPKSGPWGLQGACQRALPAFGNAAVLPSQFCKLRQKPRLCLAPGMILHGQVAHPGISCAHCHSFPGHMGCALCWLHALGWLHPLVCIYQGWWAGWLLGTPPSSSRWNGPVPSPHQSLFSCKIGIVGSLISGLKCSPSQRWALYCL